MDREKLVEKIWKLLEPEREDRMESASDSGNYDDAYSMGVEDGEVSGWNAAVKSITNLIEKEGE